MNANISGGGDMGENVNMVVDVMVGYDCERVLNVIVAAGVC